MKEDFLFGQDIELEEEKTNDDYNDRFEITDLKTATWAFNKLHDINIKEMDIKSVADEEIQRINTWQEQELKRYEDEKAYFEGLITEYYKKQKLEDKKFRLSTPYGKVSSRKTEKWTYLDEKAIIQYCKANNINAYVQKEELNKPMLKKLCKDGVNQETGEVIPDIVIEKVENISIKVE